MRLSLVTRLALLVAVIMFMATATLAVIVHRVTSSEFVTVLREESPQATDPDRQDAIARRVEEIYNTGGVSALEKALYAREHQNIFGDAAFIVIDTRLKVIATTEPPFATATVDRLDDGSLRFLVNETINGEFFDIELTTLSSRRLFTPSGDVFGELVLLPEPVDETRGNEFALRVWKNAALWLSLALVLAVASTAWMMRRALRPIEELTHAAKQLKEGGFPEALDMSGEGVEFDKLIATFNAATKTLAETDQIRRQLISDIAHELRTPVTNIKGQLEAAQQGLITPNTEFRETLQTEARLLERLVEDFQQIAISDAGQLRLNLQPLPLRETVENIIGTLAPQTGAEFLNEIPQDYIVLADEERFRQIVTNLFDNARREMPHGLRIETRAVKQGDMIALRFEDNGPGVAEIDRPHIFKRFYRAEKSRNRSTGGAGLGLTIVSGLVTAMGGAVEYQPGRSGGAAFVITLPVAAG